MIAMQNDQGRKMLTCRKAAEEYGCSMRYIRKLVTEGKIHHEMVGGSYMVPADEIRKLSTRKAGGRKKKRSEGFRAG